MHTSRDPGRPEVAHPDGLSDREVVELASAYYEDGTVRSLLERAGIRVERQPVWSGSPLLYWRHLSRLLALGLAVDGRQRLLRAASSDFPGNRVFASDARR